MAGGGEAGRRYRNRRAWAMRRHARGALFVAALACAGVTFAAHPILTEDPGTQGTGRFELELGQAFARGDPLQGGKGTEFGPQPSYRVAPTVDFIARTPWPTHATADPPRPHGGPD